MWHLPFKNYSIPVCFEDSEHLIYLLESEEQDFNFTQRARYG